MAKNKRNQQVDIAGLREVYEEGKGKYIIKHGVLSWGVSTAIIVRIIMGFYQYKFDLQKVAQSLFSADTVYTLITFSIFGAIWGRIMWVWIEKEIKKEEAKKSKKSSRKNGKKQNK